MVMAVFDSAETCLKVAQFTASIETLQENGINSDIACSVVIRVLSIQNRLKSD